MSEYGVERCRCGFSMEHFVVTRDGVVVGEPLFSVEHFDRSLRGSLGLTKDEAQEIRSALLAGGLPETDQRVVKDLLDSPAGAEAVEMAFRQQLAALERALEAEADENPFFADLDRALEADGVRVFRL